MKQFLTYGFSILVGSLFCFSANADVGKTYQLKENRKQLLQQMETLRLQESDSFAIARFSKMNQRLMALDQQIFSSYQQSIDHLVAQKAERSTNDRLLVGLAMTACAIALIFSILILMARNRVVEKENMGLMGVYRQLSNDFMKNISPEKAGETRLLRVNPVIILGLIMMGASILAFLIGSI